MRSLVIGSLAAAALVGCTSPEARRERGSGPGADVGNVASVVRMHEGSHPYWQTPRMRGIEGPPLDPARQASRFSGR